MRKEAASTKSVAPICPARTVVEGSLESTSAMVGAPLSTAPASASNPPAAVTSTIASIGSLGRPEGAVARPAASRISLNCAWRADATGRVAIQMNGLVVDTRCLGCPRSLSRRRLRRLKLCHQQAPHSPRAVAQPLRRPAPTRSRQCPTPPDCRNESRGLYRRHWFSRGLPMARLTPLATRLAFARRRRFSPPRLQCLAHQD